MRRRPVSGLTVLIGIVVATWLVTRFGRGLGLFGLVELIVPLVVVLVLLGVARAWTSGARSPGVRGRRPPPKKVTAPTIRTLDDRLRALERLHTDGKVDEAEYEAQRARLIADF